jgi:hypothetical protein
MTRQDRFNQAQEYVQSVWCNERIPANDDSLFRVLKGDPLNQWAERSPTPLKTGGAWAVSIYDRAKQDV